MTTQTKWQLDLAHSEISFKVKHLMISNVKGSFKVFDANIYTTDKDFTTAQIDVWIDVGSITTGDIQRDDHLKGPDFFNAANHKQIAFTSSTIGKANEAGIHELWGELTIKGITKNVDLQVEFGGIAIDPWGKEKAGFTVSGKIYRKDWELTWNKTTEIGGLLVGEEISILCEIELVNAGQKTQIMELKPAAGSVEINGSKK
jgi:polyisoprenoid-binding protein YceI